MPTRLAIVILALATVASITGAFMLSSLTAAEPEPALTGASRSTLAATSSIGGETQSLDDAIERLIASIRQAFATIDSYIQTALDDAAPSENEAAGLLDPIREEAEAAQEAQPAPPGSASDLQEAIRQQVQSEIEKAQAGTEPPASAPGGAPGCVTQHDSGADWTRASVHCVQKQVSSNGSSSSSVQVTSTSISSSSTNSSDSR
ncbi:MAG: hypothetical protein GEU75_15595 [Dehalococcoidia bacterium]|nr:hypothetical protein [Dehalococcoidia bacterium]